MNNPMNPYEVATTIISALSILFLVLLLRQSRELKEAREYIVKQGGGEWAVDSPTGTPYFRWKYELIKPTQENK